MSSAVTAILLLSTCMLFAQPARQKLILDTDIGTDIDDAWAVGFVAQHAGFETLAVTITDADTPARAKVACKLLQAAGRNDIPVAVGRKTPTPDRRVDYQFSWAEDFTAVKPVAESAADTIVSLARRYPGQITLLAVGPLQNVADALRKEPALPKLLRRVVLMSGNVYGRAGGKPAIPEWNVVVATQDSQFVYSSGLPLTIVPLDSTTLVQLSDEERERVRKRESPLSIALEALYRLWLDTPTSRMTLHDQLAVAEAALPGEFFGKKETLPLVVDDKGFTKIDASRGKPVSVCLEPKRNAFMKLYLETLLR
ncbi:MAG: nucleoside hydrolase [Bryobacteraceae bacterium]|nr:nucleoside hydrolase [Bryobacteraceae bacterium]